MLRLPPDLLTDLDRWRNEVATKMKQDEPDGRPEAIRDILVNHFDSVRNRWIRADARTPQKHNKSAELAARTIDAIDDQSALAEDRAKRKRRLLKGPKEFRDVRKDHPHSRRKE